MKKMIKMMLCLLVVMGICYFADGKTIYADEISDERVEEIELTEEQMQQVMQWLQEGDETVSQKEEKEYVYVTEDAPDNMANMLNQRGTLEGYTIRNYAGTYTGYTEVLGTRVDIITISVTGEVYEYEDGKIHLYSMRVATEVYVIGNVEIDAVEIENTDGTFSMGKTFVYLDSLLYGEHCFRCTVFVFPGNDANGGEAVIDVSIGQAW